MRIRKTLACFCVCPILLLAACDNPPTNPVVPSPVAVRSTASSHTLSGAVTAGGTPLAGATVSVWYEREGSAATALSAITDGNGYYIVRGVKTSVPLARVTKDGYFVDFKYVQVTQDVQFNFILDRWVSVAPGETIVGRIGDVICTRGDSGWGPKPCERFAVTVPAGETLDVTVSAPVSGFQLDVIAPDGTYDVYGESYASPLTISIPVEDRGTYEIRVVGGNPAFEGFVRDFELTAVLR